jgi:Tol biopolymer transport system component
MRNFNSMLNNPYPQQQSGQLVLAIKEQEINVVPEGKVDIHIGVINQTNAEDYVDLSVKGIPSEWVTIDTPVVRVGPGEAKQAIITIQPPPLSQSRVGRYPLDVQAISHNNPGRTVVARSYLTVAGFQSAGRIEILLASIHFSVVPGSSITIPLLLRNNGLREDTFQLNIEGIPANWVSTNAVFTRLEPSQSKEIDFTIRMPRSAEAGVGRTPFKIVFISQDFPDQKTEVDCILTVAAFSKFSAFLQPRTLSADQFGQLIINNEGNTADTYSIDFVNPSNLLIFEKEVPIRRETSANAQKVEMGYVEIPQREKIQIDAGMQGIYPFRSRLRSRPLFGNEQNYPFTVKVRSTENMAAELPAETSDKGYAPPWSIVAALVGAAVLCLLLLIPLNNMQAAARATQTAAFLQTQTVFNQTQVVLAGGEDTDGDGLINSDEIKLGTDPLKPDTDADGISDGDEINTTKTNPLVIDTDQDGLKDGDEVQLVKTDALNPDTDGDLLKDGEEVTRRTDPLNSDTDKDGLTDGIEVKMGSDPLQMDTDRDGLMDGQENQTCPRPLVPDSDSDGILDGKDLDPCNPTNPSLTATALASAPTATVPPTMAIPTSFVTATPFPTTIVVVPPTSIIVTATPIVVPTNTPVVVPTNTVVVPPTSTSAPLVTSTPVFPPIQGVMLFESNREGNSQIYAMNLTNQSLSRLTNNTAINIQPALAPDGIRVAYVSNQNGNNEIYLTGLDRRPATNLTNNPGDDQQPTWSPDGNWIAFTSNRDGNQEIYVMRSDGSEVRNLTSNSASDFAPSWFSVPKFLGLGSDDWIAFTSNRDGNQEIYRVKPDGTGLTNLTKNPSNDYAPSGFANGNKLAFVTDRDGNAEIYTMSADGGSPTNVTNNFAQDLDPAFDSKGQWITFSSDRDGNMDVYAVNLSDGKTYDLTRNPGQDGHPDW